MDNTKPSWIPVLIALVTTSLGLGIISGGQIAVRADQPRQAATKNPRYHPTGRANEDPQPTARGPLANREPRRREGFVRRPVDSSVNRVRRWLGRAPRGTPATQIGKNHELVRAAFRDVVADSNRSTVRVFSEGTQVALGTIVQDGLVVTKASELQTPLACKIRGQGTLPAEIVGEDAELDLALLKIDQSDALPPIVFPADEPTNPAIGSWVAVPGGFADRPLVVGVVSGSERAIDRDAAILGVNIADGLGGVLIERVLPGSGAEKVGVQDGDLVTSFEDIVVRNRFELVRQVRKYRPGDQVTLTIRRGDEQLTVRPQLGRPSDIAYSEQGLLAHEGGPLSQRRSGFSQVIQHDCLLQPNQCGGPLIDVDGHLIGINIARAGRVATYAIPASVVKQRVREMVRNRRLPTR